MSSKKEVSTAPVYQLKVTLKGSKPPIWRRIQVSGDDSLGKLHAILQIAMGWYGCHLHMFEIHGKEYGEPNRDLELDFNDERKTKLHQILKDKDAFVYQYDFGDDWMHQVVVEKIVPKEKGTQYPVCVAGGRACPPEDCGGIWGYKDFLEAIENPKHPEHENMIEWVGGRFDPEAFNLESINNVLKGSR